MTNARIKHALRNHRAGWQFAQVAALQALGDAVVKAPQGASSKLWMVRRTELLHDRVNLACRQSASICKLDDQTSGGVLGQLVSLVIVNAHLHIVEVRDETAHSFSKNARNVVQDVQSVTTSELDV